MKEDFFPNKGPNWPQVFVTEENITKGKINAPTVEEFKKLEERVAQLEKLIADIPYAEEVRDELPPIEKDLTTENLRYIKIKDNEFAKIPEMGDVYFDDLGRVVVVCAVSADQVISYIVEDDKIRYYDVIEFARSYRFSVEKSSS